MQYERFDYKSKKIYLVDMRKELQHYFSDLFEKAITIFLSKKKRIGIIINKKGYAKGILCPKCGYIPHCTRCSVPVSFHKRPSGELIGLCHICKNQYPYETKCPQCRSEQYGLFGMGTQQLAEEIQERYHTSYQIIDTEKANTPHKIKKVLENINELQPKILIGTSLLSQPVFNYPLDLLIFINADLGLNIPDYSANENTFLLLYEAIQKHTASHIIIQTFNPDHYVLRSIVQMDYEGFYKQENRFRKEEDYPPFAELCVLLYKDEIEERMYTKVDKVYKELLYLKEKYEVKELNIYTTPPLIYKMFGKYRYQIILKGKEVRPFMDIIYTRISLQEQGFKVHRDAESIV